jgi:hypothetical protein
MDLPRFPLKAFVEEMGPKERTLVIGLYTALLVDQAQGREIPDPRRRVNHAHTGRLLHKGVDQSGLGESVEQDPTSQNHVE